MGTDDLFYKERIKRAIAEKRRIEFRSKHKEVILIISEGKKTEPYYFDSLREHLGLNKESVRIPKNYGGNDPKTLVGIAEEEFKRELKKSPPGYDRILVVFDKDTHASYDAAKDMISKLNKKYKDKFKAITSVPCFEFWLLLHFKYTSKPYQSNKKSVCDCVTDDLKKYIPDYDEGSRDTFENTKNHLDNAFDHAEKLEIDRESAGTDNPSTNVHHLIKYLCCELDKQRNGR
ncbi:MAG: RloB domain-containing protein [Nitrospirae bacterium]|nr:RloB domain-containing protein [Nitrospirota bacterium]